MNKQVFVKEVMKVNPVIAQPFATVLEVACLMKDKKVGTVIVTEQGHLIGIVTKYDIIKKVVCEEKNASDVTVEDIMSTPVAIIDPYRPLQEALKIMERCNIQQLPVIEGNQLVGIITQHDVSQMAPALAEIDHEWSTIDENDKVSLKDQTLSGKCEDCDALSTNLKIVDGRLLCDDCITGLKDA